MQHMVIRQRAVECERLAEQSTDVLVKQYLTELAAAFRKHADRLEELAPRSPPTKH